MDKTGKDPIAQAMVQKRWAKTTEAERKAISQRMNTARWGNKKTKKGKPKLAVGASLAAARAAKRLKPKSKSKGKSKTK